MHHMRTFVQRKYGDRAWRKVISALAADDAQVVQAVVPVGWYELDVQHNLLRCIDEVLGGR